MNLPVRNNGMDRKNPPIAHIRVDAAPFRYFEVLKISEKYICISIIRYKYGLNATLVKPLYYIKLVPRIRLHQKPCDQADHTRRYLV